MGRDVGHGGVEDAAALVAGEQDVELLIGGGQVEGHFLKWGDAVHFAQVVAGKVAPCGVEIGAQIFVCQAGQTLPEGGKGIGGQILGGRGIDVAREVADQPHAVRAHQGGEAVVHMDCPFVKALTPL